MDNSIPSSYKEFIPYEYQFSHIYTISSKNSLPISYFRNTDFDFLTNQVKSDNNLKIDIINEQISIDNETYEIFDFENGKVLNINLPESKSKVLAITLRGNNITKLNSKNNCSIYKSSNDFEILLDNKRFMYIETTAETFFTIQKFATFSQIFILQSNNYKLSKNLEMFCK